jgi:DNA polymerase-3 subunit delta
MEYRSLEELEDEIKQGVVRPVYLFTGPEEYLRRLAEELILNRALAPESQAFNFSEFSIESHPIDEVLKAADTFPLASPYRLVILRNVESLAQEHEEALLSYLKRPSTKTIFLLVASSLDRRTSFYRLLKEKHCVVDFQSPKPATFERWAEQLIREKGYRISQGSIKKLIELAGSDFSTLLGEIEKLTLYAGSDKSIPDSALDELVRESREHDSFELTEAMGRRDAKAALRLLANLLQAGEAPLKIVGAIVWNFRNLLMIQELLALGKNTSQIATVLHLHPFALEKLLRQARTLENRTARKLYDRLAALDLKLKSSGSNERMILENLICSL